MRKLKKLLKNKRQKKLFASVVILFICSDASAQQDTVSQMLSEVILTARRLQQKEWLVPHGTQTITSKQIGYYQPRTAPEALMGMAGVFVQKTNHGGGSPFVRGLTGNQTLLLIDGIRLNNSTFRYGPNQYLNTIDIFTISKVEVAKGTGSVQYGTDALGGVIQIFTREPEFSKSLAQWSGKAQGKFMSGSMEKTVRGEAGHQSKKFAAQVGATYRNFGDLIGGDTTGRQNPSGYKEFSFDAKTKWQVKPHAVLSIAHQFLQQQQVPVYHKVKLENFAIHEFHPQQRMLHYARLHVAGKSKWINQGEVTASWQQSKEGRSSSKMNSSLLRKEKDAIQTYGFTADVTSRISPVWTSNSGLEIYVDKVNSAGENINTLTNSRIVSRGLYPDNAKYGNYSLYSLHHLNFNKWLFEGGIRFNTFSISMRDTTLGRVQLTPSAFVYNASIMYHFLKHQHFFLSFSTGYRAPNVDDMGTLGIVDFRYEIPSYELAPEKSRHLELGYKLKHPKWRGSLSGFYMHLDDLITRRKIDGQVINGYPVYRKENSEKGYIKGLEAEADYEITKGWHLKGNIAYTYGRNISRNEPLRRMPPLHGRLLGYYQDGKWFGSVEYLFATKQDRLAQGDKDDNRIPAGGTPGYKLLNLFAGYHFSSVNINAGLQNIFNRDYRMHGSGINGAGRSVWVSVAVEL